MKRFFSVFIALALLVTALPLTLASADTPTYTVDIPLMCKGISSATPTVCYEDVTIIGNTGSGTDDRSLFYTDLNDTAALDGMEIQWANLRLYYEGSYNATGATVNLVPITAANVGWEYPVTPYPTWNKLNAGTEWTTPGGDFGSPITSGEWAAMPGEGWISYQISGDTIDAMTASGLPQQYALYIPTPVAGGSDITFSDDVGETPFLRVYYKDPADSEATAPTATLNNAYQVLDTSAYISATVTDLGGNDYASCAFMWGDNDAGADIEAWDNYEYSFVGISVLGSGWTKQLTGLTKSTTYYYKALLTAPYAGVSYTATKSFTTLANPPVTYTPDPVDDLAVTASNGATGVSDTTATLNANIVSKPGNSQVYYWFAWDTTDQGTDIESWTNSSFYHFTQSTGIQSLLIGGLAEDTQYYYRVFAEATYDGDLYTAYSGASTFTTGSTWGAWIIEHMEPTWNTDTAIFTVKARLGESFGHNVKAYISWKYNEEEFCSPVLVDTAWFEGYGVKYEIPYNSTNDANNDTVSWYFIADFYEISETVQGTTYASVDPATYALTPPLVDLNNNIQDAVDNLKLAIPGGMWVVLIFVLLLVVGFTWRHKVLMVGAVLLILGLFIASGWLETWVIVLLALLGSGAVALLARRFMGG